MSYARPPSTAVTFTWQGATAYSRPAADSVTFSWAEVAGVSLAEGFAATQFGAPSSPLPATGFSATQFGAPVGFFNQAFGWGASTFGQPRVTQLAAAQGFEPTLFGATEGYINRATGFSVASFGFPAVPSQAAGFSATAFGEPFSGPDYLTRISLPGKAVSSWYDDQVLGCAGGAWFVHTADGGDQYSFDGGITWVPLTLTGDLAGRSLYSITYGNGRWIGTFSGAGFPAAYSDDLATWTGIPLPSGMSYWPDIVFANGAFVTEPHVIPNSLSTLTTFGTSLDGVSWTIAQWSAPERLSDPTDAFVFCNGYWWIAFSQGSGTYRSADLSSWAVSAGEVVGGPTLFTDGVTLYRLEYANPDTWVFRWNAATLAWVRVADHTVPSGYGYPTKFVMFGGDLFALYDDSNYDVLIDDLWQRGAKLYNGFSLGNEFITGQALAACGTKLMLFGYDDWQDVDVDALSFTVDYYRLMGIDASGGGFVEQATGFATTTLGVGATGFNSFSASGFTATAFALAYYPFDQALGATGRQQPRFGKPWGYEFIAPKFNQITRAKSLPAVRFGQHNSPVESTATAYGWRATGFGAAVGRLTGAFARFGEHVSRVTQAATGATTTQYGTPKAASRHSASGFASGFGVPSSARTQHAAPAYRPTRWGVPRAQQTNTYRAYGFLLRPRFGWPRATQRFNYPAQGFCPTQHGGHDAFDTHRALHIPPTARFGSPLLKRNPTC